MFRRYAPLLPRVATRGEFSDLVWELQGELGTSHAYEMGGDHRKPPAVPLGHLAAELRAVEGGWEIAATVPGVKCIEELGSHRFGPYFSIEVTICVDGSISVDEGNSIAHALEEKLKDHYRDSLSRVMIHFHPEDKTHA